MITDALDNKDISNLSFDNLKSIIEETPEVYNLLTRCKNYDTFIRCCKITFKFMTLKYESLAAIMYSLKERLKNFSEQYGHPIVPIDFVEDIVDAHIEILKSCMNDEARAYFAEEQLNPTHDKVVQRKIEMANKYKILVHQLLDVIDDEDHLNSNLVLHKAELAIIRLRCYKERIPLFCILSSFLGGIFAFLVMIFIYLMPYL